MKTRVVIAPDGNIGLQAPILDGTEVVVVDTETRHAPPDAAYRVVYSVAQKAAAHQVEHLLKKTDSALRGNIGSELAAVLDASGKECLSFIPSFPRMGRTTKDGIQYISGVPVADSVFGKDPFEPVARSYIPDIIASQSSIKTISVPFEKVKIQCDSGKCIRIYDAQSNEQMNEIVHFLQAQGRLHVMAGCAGLGEVLPAFISPQRKENPIPPINKRFLVVCGSLNEITKKQLDYAQRHGFARITLHSEQILQPEYLESAQGQQFMQEVWQLVKNCERVIIDTNGQINCNGTVQYMNESEGHPDEVRVLISDCLGKIVKKLIDMGMKNSILLTGGDTLLGFIQNTSCREIVPICELASGTVLSKYVLADMDCYVFSKSGGFGKESLLWDLAECISQGNLCK